MIDAPLREAHLDALGGLALADGDRGRAPRLVARGERLDRPPPRRHVLEHEGAVLRVERLLLVRAAPAAGAHAHHEAHAALGVGLVAHLEVGDRAAAVAVHDAPADLAGAGDDELDALRRRHDARPCAGRGRPGPMTCSS